jgi:hypothetical protein
VVTTDRGEEHHRPRSDATGIAADGSTVGARRAMPTWQPE